jgi:hypothetical protein
MKISHEAPLCLLDYVKSYNDYDYCLPHLLDKEPKYLEFFIKSKNEGRCIMMDNSLHELGESYDKNRLIYWVKYLEPDYFFVPDVWENYKKSITNAKEWIEIEIPNKTKKIFVVQGSSFYEAVLCVKGYKDLGCNNMAFSYGSSHYNAMCPHPNLDLGKAIGRLSFINILYDDKLITDENYIHLLGASVPQEFSWYKGMNFIKSLDTSNPVMSSLSGIKYNIAGLFKKPIVNMNNSFYIQKENINLDLLKHNLKLFRKINDL